MARDLADRGISVALLHPGFVRTDMTGGRGLIDPPEAASGLIARTTRCHSKLPEALARKRGTPSLQLSFRAVLVRCDPLLERLLFPASHITYPSGTLEVSARQL